MKFNTIFLSLWLALIGAFPAAAPGSSDSALASLLSKDDPPAGVVFEVVQGDPDGLNWAIPKINGYIKELRARFPGLPVAVVSHGQEQFSLLRENESTYGDTHELARGFLKEQSIPVQVCGNHAGMYGHRPDAYPDYVEVVDAAPRAIRRYREQGYEVVVVRRR